MATSDVRGGELVSGVVGGKVWAGRADGKKLVGHAKRNYEQVKRETPKQRIHQPVDRDVSGWVEEEAVVEIEASVAHGNHLLWFSLV